MGGDFYLPSGSPVPRSVREPIYNVLTIQGCVFTESDVKRLEEICKPYGISKIVEIFLGKLLSGDLVMQIGERGD